VAGALVLGAGAGGVRVTVVGITRPLDGLKDCMNQLLPMATP